MLLLACDAELLLCTGGADDPLLAEELLKVGFARPARLADEDADEDANEVLLALDVRSVVEDADED